MTKIYLDIRFALRNLKRMVSAWMRTRNGLGNPVAVVLPEPVPYRFTDYDARIVADIVRSGKLHHDQGSQMVSFEREFAAYVGVPYALATNSGTSALQLAVQSLGLMPGDEVIVPAYAFVAAAQAVLSNHAIPVFADIDGTHTISPLSIRKYITKRTRAIIVVHMFGNVADMGAIMKLAKQHGLRVIEDCAQAVGAMYHGNHVGSVGDVGCFSFNIKKAIPTGQGGMVVTGNSVYERNIRIARNTGLVYTDGQADAISFGGTFFMTEMEAALGRSVLRQLPYLNSIRRKNYAYLMDLLRPLRPYLHPYDMLSQCDPAYSRLSFVLDTRSLGVTRDQFVFRVRECGIPLKTFYPTPLYRYSLFKNAKDMLTNNTFPFTLYKKTGYPPLPYAEKFQTRHVGMEFSPYWNSSDMREIARVFTMVIRNARKSL